MTRKISHFDRFFNGAMTLIVLGMVGTLFTFIFLAIGWWTVLVPVGLFMVICLAYSLGWGWDVVKESRHRRAHGI